MARRERFTRSLKCLNCGKTGTATWEENENPVNCGGALNPTLDALSAAFERFSGSGETEIMCSECKTRVSSP